MTHDAVHRQFVVVGNDSEGRAMVWLTADGNRWTATRLSDGPASARHVTAADGVLIAAGFAGSDTLHAMAWASHDGITWSISELGLGAVRQVGLGERAVVWVGRREQLDDNFVVYVGTPR